MITGWRGVAVLLLAGALTTGCSDVGSAVEREVSTEQKRVDPSRPAATRKEDFMPILEAEYAKVTWPAAYSMTTGALWQKLGGDYNDTALSQLDAQLVVTFWNICAWSLRLIEETKEGRPATDSISGLTVLNTGKVRPGVSPILADARGGNPRAAAQFVDVNGCRNGFA